jgi:hypothetical protein
MGEGVGTELRQAYAICSMSAFVCILICLWLRVVWKKLNYEMDLEDKRHTGVEGYVAKGWRYHI